MKKYLLPISLGLVSLMCQASYNEGVEAYAKDDYQTALKAWKAVAEQKPIVSNDFEWHSGRPTNIAEAQYGLGLLYWQGKGVVQNYHEAEKWLALAAQSGHSEAQLKLAYLYLTGLNDSANVAKAMKWFERSAQQGNVDAQYNLGLLYFKGLGVVQDLIRAKKWLTAAAQQGESSAKELLAKINTPVTQANPKQPLIAKQITPPQVILNPNPAVTAASAVADSNITEADRPAVSSVDTPDTPNNLLSVKPQSSVSSTNVIQAIGKETASSPMSMNGYYTIQLLASAEQNDVLKAMEKWRNSLNPLAMTNKLKKSNRIFILVYGKYPSAVEAKQAIANLPLELKESKPWVFKIQKDVFALSVAQSNTNQTVAMQPALPPMAQNAQVSSEQTVASDKQSVDLKEDVVALKEETDAPNGHTVDPTEQAASEQIIASSKPAVVASVLPINNSNSTQSVNASTVQRPAPMDVYYSIQLLSSVNQNNAEQFVEKWRNHLNPLIISDKTKQSKRIFVVVYGKYPSAIAAKKAIDNLPAELKKNKPWNVKMRGNMLVAP